MIYFVSCSSIPMRIRYACSSRSSETGLPLFFLLACKSKYMYANSVRYLKVTIIGGVAQQGVTTQLPTATDTQLPTAAASGAFGDLNSVSYHKL